VVASAQPIEPSVNAPEDHRPPAEAVGQCAVKEIHEGEAEQVGRQRLLHLQRRGANRALDAVERRQIGIDRKRAKHAEAGQQQRQRPAGRGPEPGCVRIHDGAGVGRAAGAREAFIAAWSTSCP
jgi:hypothetical protein